MLRAFFLCETASIGLLKSPNIYHGDPFGRMLQEVMAGDKADLDILKEVARLINPNFGEMIQDSNGNIPASLAELESFLILCDGKGLKGETLEEVFNNLDRDPQRLKDYVLNSPTTNIGQKMAMVAGIDPKPFAGTRDIDIPTPEDERREAAREAELEPKPAREGKPADKGYGPFNILKKVRNTKRDNQPITGAEFVGFLERCEEAGLVGNRLVREYNKCLKDHGEEKAAEALRDYVESEAWRKKDTIKPIATGDNWHPRHREPSHWYSPIVNLFR